MDGEQQVLSDVRDGELDVWNSDDGDEDGGTNFYLPCYLRRVEEEGTSVTLRCDTEISRPDGAFFREVAG